MFVSSADLRETCREVTSCGKDTKTMQENVVQRQTGMSGGARISALSLLTGTGERGSARVPTPTTS